MPPAPPYLGDYEHWASYVGKPVITSEYEDVIRGLHPKETMGTRRLRLRRWPGRATCSAKDHRTWYAVKSTGAHLWGENRHCTNRCEVTSYKIRFCLLVWPLIY